MLGIKADELILCTLTAAAELKSWLRWHLPPILRVLPHKQIKQLYRFLSPLHFTPMTLHLHLSFVSLSPATPLPWQEAGCHLYANTCEETEEKKCFTSFEKQTASQSCRRPSSPSDWTWPSERFRPAASNHGLRADRDSERTVMADVWCWYVLREFPYGLLRYKYLNF